MCNSLPNNVVLVQAESVNIFKTRLDKFWSNQQLFYHYHAKIHGTRSRSEINQ